jgi:HD superfamily phosphodiesterase
MIRELKQIILQNNPGNINPYHNLEHTYFVMDTCYKIMKSQKLDSTELLIAAAFHDWGHSAGKLSDAQNIERALSGYQNYINQLPLHKSDLVIQLIKSTQFPYEKEPDNWNELEPLVKILRDADRLQWCQPNWKQMVLINLFEKELNKDLKEAVIAQISFIESFKPYTSWGQSLVLEKASKRLEELNILNNA